jgi:hypothetical protein
MSAGYATWDRFKHLKLHGVSYDIGVRLREDGRYLVSWVCLECFEQGPPSPAADTVEHAMELADVSLHLHHGLAHSDATAIGMLDRTRIGRKSAARGAD